MDETKPRTQYSSRDREKTSQTLHDNIIAPLSGFAEMLGFHSEPQEQLAWSEYISFEDRSAGRVLDLSFKTPASSPSIFNDTVFREPSTLILRVHNPYVLSEMASLGKGIVNLKEQKSDADLSWGTLELRLDSCMWLYLSPENMNYPQQSDFFAAIRNGNLRCVLLWMSPWDCWMIPFITRRFLILQEASSTIASNYNGQGQNQMWERIGILRVQVKTQTYQGFMKELEARGMRRHNEDYLIT
ncbi:hypothetical protein F5Y19DRAFT_474806 [Xylariaceae sp. FL1651]|nr:hypothetical protein F5Y19DRAFT_474806 [Xylariaceae sp. FL1651]